ncbi:2-oxoglutarate ferredoxin oxidoreductase subunit gamma [Desulfonauticus submarinus]|uniref:2-oxoglutarate ferredoxin oxidoreductase subunit gamma n=1 Tax=Desulfonauticus submarinus TaxID=206665 RepID=A0A1G9ZYY5_9BACT|nr:2-oxoacid:acceptor oxidoreductase family protein [Desulfonauticus submarinus]SDN25873.1 2-oxoglutarate ferredoxin oxidoreductase subunit gamma [Desulfonauticus submarinus]
MAKEYPLNRFEIRLSGLGGQGILTLGKIMGQALALEHGYYVTQTQSYGPEARGGASRSDVVISSYPISYPKTQNLDVLVALSQEACNLYFRNLKINGLLIVDNFMVEQVPTNSYVGLPFTKWAKDKIKVIQTTNIITLGALTYFLPFMNKNSVLKTLKQIFPAKIIEINVKALNLGFNQAKKRYKDIPERWLSS